MLPVNLGVCISYLRVYREHTLGMKYILPFLLCIIFLHYIKLIETSYNMPKYL